MSRFSRAEEISIRLLESLSLLQTTVEVTFRKLHEPKLCEMIKQRSSVVVLMTDNLARPHGPGATAIGAAFAGMENLA